MCDDKSEKKKVETEQGEKLSGTGSGGARMSEEESSHRDAQASHNAESEDGESTERDKKDAKED